MDRSRLRTIRGFVIGILAGLVLASTGVASAKQGRGLAPSPEVVSLVTEEMEPSEDCLNEGESDEGESDEGEECPPADEEEAEEEESDEDEPEPTESGDRQAECEVAAGLSDEEQDESEEKVTGLDNAIERVLANCIKNPQAPGLLNALRHLAENRERKMARDEAKAERRAAHDAAKSHGKGKGHKP